MALVEDKEREQPASALHHEHGRRCLQGGDRRRERGTISGFGSVLILGLSPNIHYQDQAFMTETLKEGSG